MNIHELIRTKDRQRTEQDFVSFSDEEVQNLRADQIEHLIEYFHGYTLMKLPASEVRFFEWLKEKDRLVWNDLWEGEEDLYLVSIDFLRQIAGKQPSFPICDLVDQPNYWFSKRHIKPKGMDELEDIVSRVQGGQSLNTDELLLLQLMEGPIDIWHFCYTHKLNLPAMKSVVEDMVYKGWLVHLTDREDLVKYIDI